VSAVPGKAAGAGSRTKLGEGAHWDIDSQTLLWIDVVKGKVFEWDPVAKVSLTKEPIIIIIIY